VCLLIFLIMHAGAACCMTIDRVEARLDSMVLASKTPGLQFVVVNAERVVFEYCAGWADLAQRIPMRASSTMMAYSMSKTITAAAVLQLAESHNISLDEPISRFLDFCPYETGVTVRRLLAHTAGVPNPIPLAWVHSPAAHAAFNEHAALEAVLRKHRRLSFSPGSKCSYSNIGYWLLGEFVERLSGIAFSAYVDAHVLQRLCISPSELGYQIANLPDHARGYLEKYSLMNVVKRMLIDREFIGSYSGHWLEICPHYVDGAAFGGLVGTARGFAPFLQDQLRPQSVLFGAPTRRQFYAQQHINDRTTTQTCLGWHLGALDGEPFFYKEGGGGGFHSMMRLYPNSGIGTVVMTNATGFDVRVLLDTVDPAFLGEGGKTNGELTDADE
jgi:D-alanyl-D-alanine carboxypeptidase